MSTEPAGPVRGNTDGIASREHSVPRMRPLFDMGTSAAASRLLNHLSTHPVTGELVDSRVLLEGAYSADQRVSGSMDRGPHPQSMVGWRVFDHRVAPVARDLGSHLAGCGVLAIALSINPPARARTPAARLSLRLALP